MKLRPFLFCSFAALPAQADENENNFKDRVFSGTQTIDLEYEGLFASGIEVQRGLLFYQQERADWTLSFSYTHTDYELGYQPFAPLGGLAANLNEETYQGNLSLGFALSDTLETSLSLSSYEGFADYRSIWIAEYYRQTFNFPGSGYFAPDPHGFSLTNGWVWAPEIGTKLSVDLTYGEDIIAPGWTFGSPSNDLLENRAVSIRWQQALNPSLNTETSFTYSDITDREPRLSLQTSWNYAITDSFTLGTQIGGARESSDFDSLYGGLSLTYEINPKLSLKLNARIYTDSGEIETSGFNSSAPGIDTAEIGISALYEHDAHAFQLGLSGFFADYETTDPDNEFFTNLYQDRDWITIRAAYTYSF